MRASHEAPSRHRSKNRAPDSRRAVISCRPTEHLGGDLGPNVTRDNFFYLIVGVLAIVFAAISYQLYKQHRLPEGVRFNLGPNGFSIEKK